MPVIESASVPRYFANPGWRNAVKPPVGSMSPGVTSASGVVLSVATLVMNRATSIDMADGRPERQARHVQQHQRPVDGHRPLYPEVVCQETREQAADR